MRIILMGPPGSGKGSQARLIQKEYSIPHVSTGNIFRELMKEDSALGREINKYMSQHIYVPDNLVMQVVEEYLSRDNLKEKFLFDGFPRTLSQAVSLDNIVKVDVAILLDTHLQVVEERILTRRICSCGEVYNTKTYKSESCNACGLPLKVRKDDNKETIKERFMEYQTLTSPVINYYKEQGKLIVIDADQSIEAVFQQISQIIKSMV